MEKLLKVGDIIWKHSNNYGVVDKDEIVRVTKTQAISKSGIKFSLSIGHYGSLRRIGDSSYSAYSYDIGTPENNKEYEAKLSRKNTLNYLASIKFSDLSDEKLNGIMNILKN